MGVRPRLAGLVSARPLLMQSLFYHAGGGQSGPQLAGGGAGGIDPLAKQDAELTEGDRDRLLLGPEEVGGSRGFVLEIPAYSTGDRDP